MYYHVKPNDTLSKIAKKFSVPLELLLSFNSDIRNPDLIFVNQVIYIPNMEDVPDQHLEVTTLTGNDIVAKARLAINKGIRYKLGSGGMNPDTPLPTTDMQCDCSGFVCWVLGVSRKTTIPFYNKFGGWIYTDSMVEDINSSAGIFERVTTPEIGCMVVYGAGRAIGHVGIVSETQNGQMLKVIHCSSGNDRKYNDAIQETPPNVFNRADTFWGRYVG